MFEDLKKYKTILVTGPQRSGTRIAAKMIVHDTGHHYVDERDIHIDSLYRLVDALHIENAVIHCPALCYCVHEFAKYDNGVAVAMVWRKVEDIITSQKRISWPWERLELMRYVAIEGPIAQVKYNYWLYYQKAKIAHPINLKYEDLREHPLWIPVKRRKEFTSHQTELA